MSKGTKRPTILVVDDDPGLLILIEEALRRENWTVVTANSGSDALKFLSANNADLMLLDLKLPDTGGAEFIAQLANSGCSVPFIIITGQGHERVAVEMMKRGALDYVIKDVQFLELVPEVVRHAFRQIDQQKRLITTEESLRSSEGRFRLMADHAPVLIWMSGADKLCNWFNRPWLEFTGRTLEQELGHGWAERVHAEDLDRCLEVYTKAFDARKPFSMEYRLRRHDGQWRWLYDQGVPLTSTSGAFTGYVGSCIDITERKRAEEALKESERRERHRAEELAALLDAVPTPVFIAHDSDCTHITGNRAADEMLRLPRGAEASLTASDMKRPSHFRPFKDGRELESRELPAQKAARGLLVNNFEFTLVFDDGATLELLGYGTPLRDENGQPRGAVNVVVDITERKKLEKEILEISDREQTRIGQDLHDGLGQQLTAIEFLCESLKGELRKNSSELVGRAEQICAFLRESISQTRTIAQGLSPVRMTPEGLMDALDELGRHTSAAGRLSCVFKSSTPVLVGDSKRASHLFRIAQEAVNNALKHSQANEITIELEETNDSIRLTISDNGGGFKAKSKSKKGMGLGVMWHRASVIGAELRIIPTSDGVTVCCELSKSHEINSPDKSDQRC